LNNINYFSPNATLILKKIYPFPKIQKYRLKNNFRLLKENYKLKPELKIVAFNTSIKQKRIFYSIEEKQQQQQRCLSKKNIYKRTE
jgi:hypothetical protein